MTAPPRIDDIEDAAGRLIGVTIVTPLLESPELNARLGGRLLVKAECLQRTGSFKLRGAANRLSLLSAEERERGVVAFSSGNHAQGVAAAAARLGVPATIVMPRDAPAVKVANTRDYGAKVVLYDRLRESREAIAAAIAKKSGATLVPPFEDPAIVAGQGTCGLEIAAQATSIGARLDSGGGAGLWRRTGFGNRHRPGRAVAKDQAGGRRTGWFRGFGALAPLRPAPAQQRRYEDHLRRPDGADARQADL